MRWLFLAVVIGCVLATAVTKKQQLLDAIDQKYLVMAGLAQGKVAEFAELETAILNKYQRAFTRRKCKNNATERWNNGADLSQEEQKQFVISTNRQAYREKLQALRCTLMNLAQLISEMLPKSSKATKS